LYEIENGKKKLSLKVPQRRPVADYIKPQGRFRHLKEDDIAYIQKKVDEDYELLLSEVE